MGVSSRVSIISLLFVAACDNSWGYGAKLDPGDDIEWRLAVSVAADNWNVALSTCDGPAFTIEKGGHPVLLVDKLDGDIGGIFDGDTIRVRRGLTKWQDAILTHELGHALGFEHISEEQDPSSIMNPTVSADQKISDSDIMRGRSFFGCL